MSVLLWLRTRSNRPFGYALIAAAIVTFGQLGILVARPFGGTVNLAIADLPLIVANGLVVFACAAAARREDGRARRAWLLLAVAYSGSTFGWMTFSFFELIRGIERPFPSVADAGFTLATIVAPLALLSFPTAPTDRTARLRALTDGVIVGFSMLLVSWAVFLGDAAKSPMSHGRGAEIMGGIYAFGDLMALVITLMVISRARRGGRIPVGSLLLIGAGVVSSVLADFYLTYLVASAGDTDSRFFMNGWLAGGLFTALGAWWSMHQPSRSAPVLPAAPRSALLPYACFALVTVLGLVQLLVGKPFDAVQVYTGGALVAVVMLRQFLLLRENFNLAKTLELRVEARTRELSESEERFRSLVHNSSDVISILDIEGCVTYVTDSVEHVFGYLPEEWVGQQLLVGVVPEDTSKVLAAVDQAKAQPGTSVTAEWSMFHKSGHVCRVESTITDLSDVPGVRGVVLNTSDVSDRKALEEQLTHQAFHDALTGLANRALFKDRVEHALTRARRRHAPFAVLFCDLDAFKSINDSLGHAVGDQLLASVAVRMRECVRPEDTVARLGGDEFALLLEDVSHGDEAVVVADRITDAFSEVFTVQEREVYVGVSIGIAFGDSSETVDDLLRNADLAMYMAKARGKGNHVCFEPSMHDAVVNELELENDLRRAIERDQLVLHYQPVFELASDRMAGVEALVRWQHPERGLVPPMEFIPLAEETGIIVRIGRWVLEAACRQMVSWQATFGENAPTNMSVNISGRQLQDPSFVGDVSGIIQRTGISPSCLTLEMTESVLLDDAEAVLHELEMLRELGVTLAIDDFGTGYSSLRYLRQFPVDVLKIDRSFVQGIGNQEQDAAVAEAIMRLGSVLSLQTVAEGIERTEELTALRDMGCRFGQGFLFAKPTPAADIDELLRSGRRLPLETAVEG